MGNYQVLPPLAAEEYAALKADIAERGLLVPILLDDQGNVLDGYHRRRAIEELRREGVAVGDRQATVVGGLDDDAKLDYALTLNIRRRHLTREQLQELAGRLWSERLWSTSRIADALGMPQQTIADWTGQVTGFGNLTPPERTTGKDGKSYPARRPTMVQTKNDREAERAQAALRQTPPEALPAGHVIDTKRVERIAREEHAKAVRETPVEEPAIVGVDLRMGDFRAVLADLPDESIDLILTDPPYPGEYLPLWSDLSSLAARVLKPGALLIAYSGQTFLPEVMRRLGEHLQYVWLGAVITAGPHWQNFQRSIRSGCKPLLFYSHGAYRPVEWFEDTIASPGEEKEHHDWQQSLAVAANYIATLTRPGDTVLDPFLGGGTTAAAAYLLKRHIVAAEVDARAYAIARERLAKEASAGRE